MKFLILTFSIFALSIPSFAQSPGGNSSGGGSNGTSPNSTGLDTPVGTYGSPAPQAGSTKDTDPTSGAITNSKKSATPNMHADPGAVDESSKDSSVSDTRKIMKDSRKDTYAKSKRHKKQTTTNTTDSQKTDTDTSK